MSDIVTFFLFYLKFKIDYLLQKLLILKLAFESDVYVLRNIPESFFEGEMPSHTS